jgi:hypothetical protein
MAQLVNIALLLDVPDDASAIDWVNETLREMQRAFTVSADLIDYAVQGPIHAGDELDDAIANETYEEGDAFKEP